MGPGSDSYLFFPNALFATLIFVCEQCEIVLDSLLSVSSIFDRAAVPLGGLFLTRHFILHMYHDVL